MRLIKHNSDTEERLRAISTEFSRPEDSEINEADSRRVHMEWGDDSPSIEEDGDLLH